jgi:glutathione S-transferase
VQKVMWLVGELTLDHRHVNAGGGFGGLDDPGFRALNPHGRVPVIDDDGTVVWESHSILRYLAARHGGATLWPQDPGERSEADRWLDWMLATLQPAFMDVFWGFYRTPPAQRDDAAIRAALDRCHRCYAMLDAHLAARSFLAGSRFSIGDIAVGASLFRFLALELPHPALPNLRAWYERLCARPAYRAHVMLPFEDLRGRLDY